MSSEQPPARPVAARTTADAGVRALPHPAGAARRLPAALAALLLTLGLVVVGAAHAQAHDEFLGSDPTDGSTVATAPERVTLTFGEPAQALGTEIVVAGPDGSQVSDGAPELVDSTVSQALAGTLPAGTYTVTWRVTSEDGHPVSGTFTFTASAETTVGVTDPGPAATTETGSEAVEATDEATVEPSAGAVIAPAPTATASPSVVEETAADEDAGIAAGAIVAIIVAVLAVGALTVLVVRQRRRPRGPSSGASTSDGPTSGDGTAGDRTES